MIKYWKKSKYFRFFIKIEKGKIVSKVGSLLLQLGAEDTHIIDQMLEDYYGSPNIRPVSPAEEEIEASSDLHPLIKFEIWNQPGIGSGKTYGLLDLVITRGIKEEEPELEYNTLLDGFENYENEKKEKLVFTNLTFQPLHNNSLLKYLFETRKIESLFKFKNPDLREKIDPKHNHSIDPDLFAGYEKLWDLFSLAFIANFKLHPGFAYRPKVRSFRGGSNSLLNTVHTLRGREAFRMRKINFRRKAAKKQIYDY